MLCLSSLVGELNVLPFGFSFINVAHWTRWRVHLYDYLIVDIALVYTNIIHTLIRLLVLPRLTGLLLLGKSLLALKPAFSWHGRHLSFINLGPKGGPLEIKGPGARLHGPIRSPLATATISNVVAQI